MVMLWDVWGDGGWEYGHVFATNGWRLWGVCCCVPTRVTCRTLKYGHVFRTGYMFRLGIRPRFRHPWVALVGRMLLRPYTCYMPYIKIRSCYSNWEYISVRDTEMFFEPGMRYASKYECVFRTGRTLSIKIRTCFPNWSQTIHRNTAVFSELGEGVDEPEDGEEDDGGAYDAVQYADAANVEPSAEA